MIHTRDAKIADPVIHFFVSAVAAQMLVEALRVERGDLFVLLPVVHEEFSAALLKGREGRRVRAYAVWVQRLCCACVDGGVC